MDDIAALGASPIPGDSPAGVEAKGFMERAREIDPEQETVKGLYPLYQIYYNLGDKAKAAELEQQLNN